MILVVLNDGETYTSLEDCNLVVINQDKDIDDHEIKRLVNKVGNSINISSVLQDAIEDNFTNHYRANGEEYTEYSNILWKRNSETGEWEPLL